MLGGLLIHAGHNEQAARVLEVAFAAEPWNEEHWIRLLAAHHRAGNLARARELLTLGEGLIPKEQLDMFAYGISQPPPNRIESVMGLLKRKNYVSAEISARMLIEDFPDHPLGWAVLRDVFKETGREQEAETLCQRAPTQALGPADAG